MRELLNMGDTEVPLYYSTGPRGFSFPYISTLSAFEWETAGLFVG